MAFLAVVFDFDGTLVDSEPVHFRLYADAAAELGQDLDPTTYRRELQGRSDEDTIRAIVDMAGVGKQRLGGLVRRKQAAYAEMLTSGDVPEVPGAAEFVRLVAADGLRIAVATSATPDELRAGLASLGVQDHVNATVCAEEVERGKPAPDLFLEASRRLGVPPERCLAYEDAAAGVESALAAGMRVVVVGPAGESQRTRPGVIATVSSYRNHRLPND